MGDNQNGPLDLNAAAAGFAALGREDDNQDEETAKAGAESEADEEEAEEAEDESDEDGDEESDEEGDEEETARADGRIYTVKVDGVETKVTERELLDGYQRQSAYTKKSQALAEERKAHDAAFAAVQEERRTMAHWAQQMLQKLHREAPVEPDWDKLRAEDPIGFAATWAEHQRYREQQALVAAQYQAVIDKTQQDEHKRLTETLTTEANRLVEALPEWKDEARATKEKASLMAYGKKQGFSDEELSAVFDHRTVLVLRKAMLYDRIQSKRPEVEAARTVARPAPAGNAMPRRFTEHAKAMKRLEKSGSIEDAAAAFARFA